MLTESRPLPRPVKYPHKTRAGALQQRKPVSNYLVSRFEKPENRKPVQTQQREKEAKKLSEDLTKKVTQLTSTEPSLDGHYELNTLMSGALESELQRVMIKVWQELPDSPPSEADRLVVDRFRSEIGDDLKNALGLNVTKRILNVMNPLYVKIEFDKKPYGLSVQSFLRWLNCTAMKRVMDGQHNYIAQLKNPADLDRVTRQKVTKIGGLTAKVTPYYKFTKCPSKLKTIYKVSTKKAEKPKQEIKTQNNEKEENANKKVETTKKTTEVVTAAKKQTQISKIENTKLIETAKKVEQSTKKIEAKPGPVKASTASNISAKTTPTSSVSNVVAKPNVAKTTAIPITANTPAKANVVKTTPAPTGGKVSAKTTPISSASKVATKSNVAKITATPKTSNVTAKANVAKTATPTSVPVKSNVAKTATPISVPAKSNVAKTTPSKVEANTAPQAKPSNKDTKVTEKPKTAQVTATKAVNKSNATKPLAPKVTPNKTDKSKLKKNSDFDELDDEDILALMSNAIVLDECTGSDED